MNLDEFDKAFNFQYSARQWGEIARVIEARPGRHDLKGIRETLELEARRYLIIPQLETKTQRGATNLAYAKKVARACEHLKGLLTDPAYSRDYSLESLMSRSERDAIAEKVGGLQATAEATAFQNSQLSQKNRRADPQRDIYLGRLCALWVGTIHGPKTTSFRRAGQATGPFVDFLFLAAQPVLGQFTHNAAAALIKKWRKP